MKKRQLGALKKRAVVAGIVILLVLLIFFVYYMIAKPSGSLDVLFTKNIPVKVQVSALDESGSFVFLGSPQGKLIILDVTGEELANIDVGLPVLEIFVHNQSQKVIIRTSSFLVSYTFDGKQAWKYEVNEYYPQSVQALQKNKIGIYMKSKRGELPMVCVLDISSGKEQKKMKLEIEAYDFSPAFANDANSIIYEVSPGMLSRVELKKNLPMVWKVNLDTKSGRYSSLKTKITDSNLAICYFERDEKESEQEKTTQEFYVFEIDKYQANPNETVEMKPFWFAVVSGKITDIQFDPQNDNILVHSDTISVFNRDGELLLKEPEGSIYNYSQIGHDRFVSAFFLDNFNPKGTSTQFVGKGIGREGVIWRYTDTRNYLLPAVTPNCETLLIAAIDSDQVTLLRLKQ